ncbi:DNA polymerase I [Alistipes senegalensis]|uniref:DNA polymerase I n=1 Tax=Alistipes senegalensis JC50 TaxID=1033732 RepID=A0ABY5VAK7_9BACT|nr:DNA polymerase I [Alistipes senegalensis]UEA85890.1 DNA polymerase I [Alistipes senegalensis]UWN66526.1 DNA polymerase I [Alistipes senegalensis JC50]
MKKLFLVDAYALIFKYYYAFLGRPMRNRAGMNTSVVFGFVKFLRDIQKRERPDLLGVAFDPKGGSFRRDIFPEYKANRSETPEDILLSVPYVKRVLEAMCIPILEVEGYEADDVIGTLSQKGVEAGYDVYMVTPDKDYGQLVRDHCRIYKQRGAEGSIEIVGREAIREKYGIDDPQLVRDILALWGDASDNIPGVPGIGEKSACKLVQEWGTVENILDNVSKIKGKQGEKIAEWADNLRLAKRLTTICLDVPIPFREEDLTVCEPHIDELRGVFAELDFKAFMNDLANLAPPEALPEGPRQEAQTQLAEMARAKSAAAKKAALAGQGNLFGDPVVQMPEVREVPVAELQAEADAMQLATAQNTPHEYTLVESAAQLREVVAEVGRYEEFCFDTETTGFDIFNDRIVGLSLAVEPFKAWYVPFKEENTPEYAEIVRPLFEDERIAKIGQNIKFDLMVLRRLGIEIRGRKYDTMILHYLLDPESRHNMNALSERYLNYKPIEIETLIGKGSKQLTMDLVNVERVKEYAAEDADVTLRLKQVLYPQVEEIGLQHLYFEVEEPMIAVLADIEMAGVRIDTGALAVYAVELNRKLGELEAAIRTEAGEPNLNINSARQLGEVLFAKMRIAEKPKMTRTKQFCTDEDYLQSFARKHRIVDLILEYRGVKKLLSTYVEALPQLVNRTTGRIHTSFNQAVTATGRLSSTNPNLQNIPVRDDMGRRIRKAFIPSDDDHLLLSADYSQVELRLMAHLSGDESLISAFGHGEDIHTATAAKLFNKPLGEVTPEERRRAKTANFGIIYGISAFGLSQRLEIPRKEAKEIIDGYFASYPKVKEYMDNVVAKAKEEGFVSTIFGRRRYLNDISSHNAVARGLAERNAVNAPIQGSAADIMKIAMIDVHRRFAAEGIRSRVILQVHDELVVDMLRSEQERVTKIVTECMESAAQLKVRLIADAGIGGNWLEAH